MKWLDAFLEFKNEAGGTRRFALFAVVVITFGLISLAVTGVVATANWSWMSGFPAVGLIIAVTGGEILATVAFIRMLTAPTMKRKVIGFFIFLGLAAVGVHNAENGAKVVWPDRFGESSASLSARADLAASEAQVLGQAQQAAIDGTGAELERVRLQLANLEIEQRKMAAQSPEGIREAQATLLAQGKYFGRVDGIRADLTEAAMRARGEELQAEIAVLRQREAGLLSGRASPVQQTTTDRLLDKIAFEEQATQAFWAWFWLIFMLCVLESARSLSLWAYITDIKAQDADRERERENEIAEAEHAARLAGIRAAAPVPAPDPTPDPVPADPQEAPAADPDPVEDPDEQDVRGAPPQEVQMTDQARSRRKGGKNADHNRRADKIEDLIVVGDWEDRDALMRAAE